MAESDAHTCAVCHAPATQFCSRCRNLWYCTRAHQTSDWRAHKKTCTAASYSTTVQGLLVPYDDTDLRLVPVTCDVSPDDFDKRSQIFKPDIKAHLGDTFFSRHLLTTRGAPDAPPIPHWLTLFMRDNYLNDGSPPNRCVRTLAPRAPHDWRGNLLVLRNTPKQSDAGRYTNVNLQEDVAALQGWLQWYGSQTRTVDDVFKGLGFKPNVVVNL